MELTRRTMLISGVALGGVAATSGGHTGPARAAEPAGPAGADQPAAAPQAAATDGGITVDQAINVALTCDPATGRIVHDAVNALWLVPPSGGAARRLTDDAEDATWPSFFPGGARIAFQSFRRGTYDLCAVDLATGTVERLTRGPQYDVEPAVSPDGRRIAYVSEDDGTSVLRCLDLATGRTRTLAGTGDGRSYRSPTWHPGGRSLAYVVGETEVETLHLADGRRTPTYTAPAGQVVRGTSYSPGGALAHVLVDGPRARLYVEGRPISAPAEEPGPFPVAWLSATELVHGGADGLLRRRTTTGPATPDASTVIPFTALLSAPGTRPVNRRPVVLPDSAPVRGIAGPVLSPDASAVCFRALGALWLLPFGGTARRLTDDGDCRDPHWFPDGRAIVHSSDRTGVPQLWRHPLDGGPPEQLTDRPGGALLPSVSPSGRQIAFQDEAGALHVLDLDDGTSREVLPVQDHAGKASWSPDGTRLSLAVLVPASERETAGLNRVLTVETATGRTTVQAIAPGRSVGTRGDDGPVWAPDGTSLLVVAESLVHRVPVRPDGRVSGRPRRLSDRIADAISVSADGHVLFLSLGEFVLLPPDRPGRTTRPARHGTGLTCRARPAPPRTVVRAGALWDGTGEGYRRDVDITVEDGVITSVAPVRRGAPAPTVDASDRTVLPGLIDVHNHWHLRGRQWAGRQGPLWLAYGVTTSRSTGDPVYRMLETREALHSGAVPGPRYLGSGEPLDGARVRFGFMRPVHSRAQLHRELRRAEELGYHVLKSYQRLPVALERVALRRMRRAGTQVVSHYLYPAVGTGLNGMEHTGGENRLGYSRTLSYAAGRTAEDTVTLLARSGMYVSTTLLFAHELYLDSRDLIEDPRTRTLFPSWEYAALLARAEAAAGPGSELDRAWTEGDVDLLLRVQRAGGLVVAGTDAPLDFVGISVHQNLRALVRHGFTPVEALRTATANAAEALGAAGTLGVVRSGARADLLVVDGDPLRDITAAARVEQVLVDGFHHTVRELLAPYAGLPQKPAPATAPKARPVAGCCRSRPATPR
ncbi:amidohydrolase [Streptomyces sp. NWU49]|uniref:amidohydrolase family protein n=1 Tax=Streptomyces sp. NWU49 TaxID=2201153 RepID=UPI000D67DCD5|nr:amidohydrolase family protein [Streptomyces sp. NWU49]PWJ02700.1 amidohydrolase [Streptomyces sp. NWU49]